MMKNILIILFMLFSFICTSQEKKIYINKENKGWNKSDTIEITLNDGFNDTLIIYLNNKIIYHNYTKTNESTSIADFFVIKKSKMKLKDKNYIYIYRLRKGKKEKMIGFYLDLRYKYISIYNLEHAIEVYFENTYHCCAE